MAWALAFLSVWIFVLLFYGPDEMVRRILFYRHALYEACTIVLQDLRDLVAWLLLQLGCRGWEKTGGRRRRHKGSKEWKRFVCETDCNICNVSILGCRSRGNKIDVSNSPGPWPLQLSTAKSGWPVLKFLICAHYFCSSHPSSPLTGTQTSDRGTNQEP